MHSVLAQSLVKAPQPRLFVVYGDGEAGESVSTQETHDIPWLAKLIAFG